MRLCRYILFFVIFAALSCGGAEQFTVFEQQEFNVTPIGSSVIKVVSFQNTSLDDVQHLIGLKFDTGSNLEGNFVVDKVEVGGVAANPRDKDITVPTGSVLQLTITYTPLNLNTTIATYGGWTTGVEEIYNPKAPAPSKVEGPADINKALLGIKGDEGPEQSEDAAIHRAMLVLAYDYPKQGIVQVELIGRAVPGPDGEISAAGAGTGECPTDAGTACYKGGFAIEMPALMSDGAEPLDLTGAVVFGIAGSNVTLDMNTFPAALLVLKGNGPGEPLEGKPISAVSIVISGAPDVVCTGAFDGSRLTINGIGFRIRVVLGEIKKEDITPGLQAAVDFNIVDLKLTTTKPYTNGSIGFMVDTTLSPEPSGNPLFDQFLGSTQIIVTMDGTFNVN